MNRPEKLKLFILMLALICAIAVGAHAQEPDQLYRVDEIPIKNLSKILPAQNVQNPLTRSEERRVGKECRSRWSPYH